MSNIKPFAIACKANELLAILGDMETQDQNWVHADRCPVCWSRDVEVFPEIGHNICYQCFHHLYL